MRSKRVGDSRATGSCGVEGVTCRLEAQASRRLSGGFSQQGVTFDNLDAGHGALSVYLDVEHDVAVQPAQQGLGWVGSHHLAKGDGVYWIGGDGCSGWQQRDERR